MIKRSHMITPYGISNAIGVKPLGRYNGCAGLPSAFLRRHRSGTPSQAVSAMTHATRYARLEDKLPHAAITIAALRASVAIWLRFTIQLPSRCTRGGSILGLGVLNENRFVITMPPAPSDFAKPMHLRIVGSFVYSSAIDGLSPIKLTTGKCAIPYTPQHVPMRAIIIEDCAICYLLLLHHSRYSFGTSFQHSRPTGNAP